MGKTCYALETREGFIEVTKGAYLCAVRRNQLDLKTKLKGKSSTSDMCDEDPCCSVKTVRMSKRSQTKTATVKKSETIYQKPESNRTSRKLKAGHFRAFASVFDLGSPIFEDSELFPHSIQQFNVSGCKLG